MKPSTKPIMRNGTPTWEVPEITLGDMCDGCMFHVPPAEAFANDIGRCSWETEIVLDATEARAHGSKSCLVNRSIFIPATPEGWAGYIALRLSN
jgi:hypothetical protein